MIDVLVDNSYNSIKEISTGDILETHVVPLELIDLEIISKSDWKFNWVEEYKNNNIYKLVLVKKTDLIQGLISISLSNGFTYISLVENAPSNMGLNKNYSGIGANLFGFACLHSQINGFRGEIAFDAKTELFDHYKKHLNAERIGSSNSMIINEKDAIILINRFYNEKI